MKPRISMITLGVKGLNKSIDFYEKGLDFPRRNWGFFTFYKNSIQFAQKWVIEHIKIIWNANFSLIMKAKIP